MCFHATEALLLNFACAYDYGQKFQNEHGQMVKNLTKTMAKNLAICPFGPLTTGAILGRHGDGYCVIPSLYLVYDTT